ncbi:hypothetical protein K2173_027678 [Erythroxylum novogranatense]|uniref:Uncharacterized protein n=1 Tax=Erythroxylum novogranatense TaxID=1862640 RepID=A0AAV8U123_9ROSI|nr:hypothetical protein K2173_027678 [Erythroxylum novogranatense]
MDILKGGWKGNLLRKAWDRCRSMGAIRRKKSPNTLSKSNSWNCTRSQSSMQEEHHSHQGSCRKKNDNKKSIKLTPEGCFSVYVGPQKQRFVMKTKYASHPLFRMLLEDAEMEYGYNSQGPLLLPCDVDLFYKVLSEIDNGDEVVSGCSPLAMFSPRRSSLELINSERYGAYRILPPSPMLKLNES